MATGLGVGVGMPYSAARGDLVLSRSTVRHEAGRYSGSGSSVDLSGNGHDATLSGVRFLPYTGTPYLYLPGSNGNYAYTPHAAAYGVTDLDARVDANAPWAVPGANLSPFAKYEFSGGNNKSWTVDVLTSGALRLTWSPDGSSTLTQTSSAHGIADNVRTQIRVTLDVDDGAGNRVIAFYKRTAGTDLADSSGWTLISVHTVAGTTTLFNATAARLEVGSFNHGQNAHLPGRYYDAVLMDSVGGNPVFQAGFGIRSAYNAAIPGDATSLTADTGQTVTLNVGSSGFPLAVVDEAKWLFDGTASHMEIADHADLDLGDAELLTLALRVRARGGTVIASKLGRYNVTSPGYTITRESGNAYWYVKVAANTNDLAGVLPAGQQKVVAGVARATQIEGAVGGTLSGSPTTREAGSSANALPLRIGVNGSTLADYFRGEVMDMALWREALNSTDITRLNQEWAA